MTIAINPLTAEQLAARSAVQTQKQPLEPFPPAVAFDAPWNLNRAPRRFTPAPAILEEGQTAPPPRQRPCMMNLAGPGPTPSRSFAWRLVTSGVANGIALCSTPIIPWPFRIAGFNIDPPHNLADVDRVIQVQLYAVNQAYDQPLTQIHEQPLIETIQAQNDGTFRFGLYVRALTMNLSSPQNTARDIATAVIGTSVLEPNKRIAIGITESVGVADWWAGSITVERIAGEKI